MKLSNICNLIEGSKVLSDGNFTSMGLAVSKCEEQLLSFIENEKYIDGLGDNITCLITTKEIGEKLKDRYGILIVEVPRIAYFKLHNKLAQNVDYIRREFETIIGDNCSISKLSSISSKNVKIGNNVIIEEFVVIRENTTIKDNSIIRSGCILGGEGYEYKREAGSIMNVNHTGGVIIEEFVEIQYNSCVDKALYTWDNTTIGAYTKLDNFVHIEHGVKIGARNLIASRTTIGGRTVIGSDSWVGLGAIISNGLIIGEKCSISLGSVVTKSLENGEKVSGNFAINHNKYIEFIKTIR